MRVKTVLMAMMLGLLFSSTACSSGDSPKYTRSDCIVEVELAWSIEGVEKVKLLNSFADALDSAENLGYEGPVPAGFTFQQNDTRLYIQYFSECEERLSNAESLLANVAAPVLSDKVRYLVSENKVLPDVETIMLEGAAWID